MKSFLLVLMLAFSHASFADFTDKLIDDMGANEAVLMNAPDTDWSQHGYLDMGFAARGDATPSYWANIQGARYTDSQPWTAIVPWFHIWPADGNSGTSRVKVWDIKVQFLINDKWIVLDLPSNQWAQLEPWNLIGGKGGIDQRDEGGGAFSYIVDNSGPIHGGNGKYDLNQLGVDPSSIEGVAISAKAEIIEGDGVLLFEIGGDYYPNVGVSVEQDFKAQWGPAIGGSKFTLINGETCVYMTTINPPGTGDTSKYEGNGGKVALTHDELRANPPHNFCEDSDVSDSDNSSDDGDNDSDSSGDNNQNDNDDIINGGGSNAGNGIVNGKRVAKVSKRIIKQLNKLKSLYAGKNSQEIDSDVVVYEADVVIEKLLYLIDLYE